MKFTALPFGGLVVGSLLLLARPLHAQADACGLLKPADLTAVLGEKAVATPHPNSCMWKSADGVKKLSFVKMHATGQAAQMAFMGGRQAAANEGSGKVTDETGMGDKAYAVPTSFGVQMVFLKNGGMAQMQYYTGGEGTAKDVDALRPVAKKAVGAL